MVEVLNGLTARDALCLLVGCMLTVLDEAPSDEERQRSLVSTLKSFGFLSSETSFPRDCVRVARPDVARTFRPARQRYVITIAGVPSSLAGARPIGPPQEQASARKPLSGAALRRRGTR